MQADYTFCLSVILQWEGGWSDNPLDNGHATMKGVTLATYSTFLGYPATSDQLRNIPDADIQAIYSTGYWAPVHGDDLPAGVDLITFDCAVNQGVRRASQTLQEALGVVADGIIGPQTLKATTDDPRGAAGLIQDISALRLAFYQSLDTYDTFGKGWTARLTDVTEKAIALASQQGT